MIYVDFDNVLNNFAISMMRHMNEIEGKDYGIGDLPGSSPSRLYDNPEAFLSSKPYSSGKIKPLDGSFDMLKKLSEIDSVCIVTEAKTREEASEKINAIREWFPGIRSVTTNGNRHMFVRPGDTIVDDRASNLLRVSPAAKRILFTQGGIFDMNAKRVEGENILVADTYDDVVRFASGDTGPSRRVADVGRPGV